jgi:hypothetical protein
MPVLKLTEKGSNLIRTEIIDGEKYCLCDIVDGREIWLRLEPLPQPSCSICGYQGVALDRHHVHGKKVSCETILVCANCHRELHAGVI